MENLDIFSLDKKVKNFIDSKNIELDNCKNKLKELLTIDIDVLQDYIKNDINKDIEILKISIENISNIITNYEFYKLDFKTIEKMYYDKLKMKEKVSFMKLKVSEKEENNSKLAEVYDLFFKTINKYGFDIIINIEEKSTPASVKEKKNFILNSETKQKICSCGSKKFLISQTSEICELCGIETEIYDIKMNNKDCSRISINNKYTYERKVHFKECMNQYQGKQNTSIKQEIYNSIEKQLELYKLLNTEATSKKKRFERVTKEHILMILKELSLCKHYEDYVLIYNTLTTKENTNDITYIESDIMDDFVLFIREYDKKYGNLENNRKSFINAKILLYQLLCNRKHPCKLENFSPLKSIERLYYHDQVIREIFQNLGWNFTSLF